MALLSLMTWLVRQAWCSKRGHELRRVGETQGQVICRRCQASWLHRCEVKV